MVNLLIVEANDTNEKIEIMEEELGVTHKQGRKATNETPAAKGIAFASSVVLPDGKGSFVPCPELLIEEQAILYLRLDRQKANPAQTLRYYRERGKLKSTKIGKNLFYSRKELDRFIERMTYLETKGA